MGSRHCPQSTTGDVDSVEVMPWRLQQARIQWPALCRKGKSWALNDLERPQASGRSRVWGQEPREFASLQPPSLALSSPDLLYRADLRTLGQGNPLLSCLLESSSRHDLWHWGAFINTTSCREGWEWGRLCSCRMGEPSCQPTRTSHRVKVTAILCREGVILGEPLHMDFRPFSRRWGRFLGSWGFSPG